MAVPKKRTSKAKKNQRKFHWKKKALKQYEKYNSMFDLRTLKIQKGQIVLDSSSGEETSSSGEETSASEKET